MDRFMNGFGRPEWLLFRNGICCEKILSIQLQIYAERNTVSILAVYLRFQTVSHKEQKKCHQLINSETRKCENDRYQFYATSLAREAEMGLSAWTGLANYSILSRSCMHWSQCFHAKDITKKRPTFNPTKNNSTSTGIQDIYMQKTDLLWWQDVRKLLCGMEYCRPAVSYL